MSPTLAEIQERIKPLTDYEYAHNNPHYSQRESVQVLIGVEGDKYTYLRLNDTHSFDLAVSAHLLPVYCVEVGILEKLFTYQGLRVKRWYWIQADSHKYYQFIEEVRRRENEDYG